MYFLLVLAVWVSLLLCIYRYCPVHLKCICSHHRYQYYAHVRQLVTVVGACGRSKACLPPEAALGMAPGAYSNVYAFGMLMYEVLFRREPYQEQATEVGSIPVYSNGHP